MQIFTRLNFTRFLVLSVIALTGVVFVSEGVKASGTEGEAGSSDASCPMTYATFEQTVPHNDLEECPKKVDGEKAFCRMAMAAERVHVFYFSDDGGQCLLRVQSFDHEDVEVKLPKK